MINLEQGDEEVPAEGQDLEPKEFLVAEPETSMPVDAALEGAIDGVPQEPDPIPENASVDEMLSAEVLPEGMDLPVAPVEEAAIAQGPTFHLQFYGLTSESRPLLKKTLEAQGLSVSDKAWAAEVPVVSQLNEFQAVLLLQAAHALGVQGKGSVQIADPVPSEDDLALGDLSMVPEPADLVVEAAPSVVLPKGEKEVMLCTPDALPGGSVMESFGIVIAHRSIARRLFREEELRDKLQKELRSVPNRPNTTIPSSHLQIVLRDLMLALRKEALSRGANAVLGVKLEAFPESTVSDPQLEQLRLVAFGTAAVVEKNPL